MLKCKGHNLSLVVLLFVPRTKVRLDAVYNNVSKVMME